MGWKLKRWCHPSILTRLYALEESGIKDQWRRISDELAKLRAYKFGRRANNGTLQLQSKQPVSVSLLDSNIATVFVIGGVGVGLCIAVWLLEVIPTCLKGAWKLGKRCIARRKMAKINAKKRKVKVRRSKTVYKLDSKNAAH
ncbi:hypothetical protein Fcan01_26368 [Folsomia candida]|uniref:Uncharacterized protein n=1 Tax=Folsomia candida TaxID=158441 RepID=A0A226D0Z7_FOLCA|nr:hypothetical protein Fcan01_26368 [Folsomia candida]